MNSYYKNIFSDYLDSQVFAEEQAAPPGTRTQPARTQPQVQTPPHVGLPPNIRIPPMIPAEPFTYPQNYKDALQLMLQAIDTEAENLVFYQYLVNEAPTSDDKNIISGIQKDEVNHYVMLRQMYTKLTGQAPPASTPYGSRIEQIKTYCQGLYAAFLQEIEDGKNFRKMLYAMQDRSDINMMTDIIADKIENASLYSLLYSKNRCGSQSTTQY